MSVKAVLRKDRQRSDGKQPINIRVTRQGNASYVSMKIYIDPKKWYADSGKAKATYPGHHELNKKIEEKIIAFEKAENKLLMVTTEVSAKQVIAKSEHNELTDIFKYCVHYTKQFDNKRQRETHRRYMTHMDRLLEYIKSIGFRKPELQFRQIDLQFLRQFEQYLIDEGLKQNTRAAIFKNIRALFNSAINMDEVIPTECYPFRKFKFSWEETEATSLTEDEIVKLASVKLVYMSDEFHGRTSWILCYCFSGMRIGDLLSLRWSEISDLIKIDHEIRKNQGAAKKGKKSKWIRLTIPPQATAILKMYKQYNDSLPKPSQYVIPIMEDVEFDDLPEAIKACTIRINNGLKIACEKAEIKKITTHSSRRSYATIAANTLNIVTANALLKQSKIETTKGYITSAAADKLSIENTGLSKFIPMIHE